MNVEMFRNPQDRELVDEVLRATRIKAAGIITRLQQTGHHWTLTVKPENNK
jgi:CHASE1-domain containing sensor protein